MTAQAEPLPPSVYVHLRPVLHQDALLGLPAEIAIRCAEATGADVAPCLLTALTMIGNAAGGEPHVLTPDGAEHSGRLFAVVVGETGVSRKGTGVNSVRRVSAAADPRWAGRITGGLQSPQKMIELVDDGGNDTRLMLIEPEFARLLGIMARTQFGPELRKAWDGEVLENQPGNPKRNWRASHAHVSLIGEITPAELERYHNRLSQEGGMENRLLFCLSAPWPLTDWFDLEPADFSDLIDRLRLALDLSRSSVLEQTDPISRAIFLERGAGFQPSVILPLHDKVRSRGEWKRLVKDRLLLAESDDMAALWARAEAQVIRLAAAYAIGTGSDTVNPEHVKAAVAMWNYCAQTVEVLFTIAAVQDGGRADRGQARKLLDYLRTRQGWVTQTALNKQVFQGNAKSADIKALLAHLAARRHIETRVVKDTGGGPRTEVRIAPPNPQVRKDEQSP